MDNEEFTMTDLVRILHEAAGVTEGVDFYGEILDVNFEGLGYESLALLETGSRIEREYGITLDDTVLIDAETPRAMLQVVNSQLDAAEAV